DGERTPMQWDTSNAQAGFSTSAHTWLPVPPDYRTVNVRTESADPESLLNWHKRLIALRRSNAALRNGRTVMLDQPNASVLTYARVAPGGETIVVSLNMSGKEQSVSLGARAAGLEGDALLLPRHVRSEEHTSELQSQSNLVCRLLLEKKKHIACGNNPRVCDTRRRLLSSSDDHGLM